MPVAMKRSVVKLDDKKAAAKLPRWNAISESAAKQSKRSLTVSYTHLEQAAKRIANIRLTMGCCVNIDMAYMLPGVFGKR